MTTTKMKPVLLQPKPKEKEKISKGLREKIDDANRSFTTFAQKVKTAYEYAIRVDKLTPLQARDILYKNLKYDPAYIRQYLPQEAKDTTKQRFGMSNPRIRAAAAKRKLAKKLPQKEIIVDQNVVKIPSDYNIQDAITVPESTRGRENIVMGHERSKPVVLLRVQPQYVKKFYDDLDKVKDRAQELGLEIHSDLHVNVMNP